MELYVLLIKETQEVVSAKSIKQYWKSYGSSSAYGLYGWRPPKKIYDSLGRAKAGFAHIPADMKPLVEIAVFEKTESILEGSELQQEQDQKLILRRQKQEEQSLKYLVEKAQQDLEKAQQNLNQLTK